MEMNNIGKQDDFWETVRNLKKSATDKKIAGVCGGFGKGGSGSPWPRAAAPSALCAEGEARDLLVPIGWSFAVRIV